MFRRNKKIEDLVDLVEKSEINEIEISTFWGAKKIRISKTAKISNTTQYHSEPKQSIILEPKQTDINNQTNKEVIPEADIHKDKKAIENDSSYIKAPLVGTFYLKPKPTDPPYVNVGDSVKKGQVICIIEAMKIFNEIECDYDGTITEIMVSDAEPVEYNQNLFKIEK